MRIAIAVIIITAVVVVTLINTTRCRTGNRELPALRGWLYAHRGLHGPGVPENSMAAFRAALEGGFGIELDVHLTKDGRLAVLHDASLKRTAGADVKVEELTAQELEAYTLEGTGERIPLLEQVLELYECKAPIILELKPVGGNHDALCLAVARMLDNYRGTICVESFDPRCVQWFKLYRPGMARGQLVENFLANRKNPLNPALKLVLSFQMSNFLSQPDFVAFKFADRKHISNWLVRKRWKVQSVTWTITSQKDLDTAVAEGYLPIFEGFVPTK